MFMPFAAGLLAGMLSGVLFAMGFCWHILAQSENGPGLFTPRSLDRPCSIRFYFFAGVRFFSRRLCGHIRAFDFMDNSAAKTDPCGNYVLYLLLCLPFI